MMMVGQTPGGWEAKSKVALHGGNTASTPALLHLQTLKQHCRIGGNDCVKWHQVARAGGKANPKVSLHARQMHSELTACSGMHIYARVLITDVL
jgi:hypothetical protein